MELKGIDYLRQKLAKKRSRVKLRYKYYEEKQRVRDFGISTPPDLRYFNSVLGWCTKSVDVLADRLQFRRFRNDPLDMTGILDANNKDVLTNSGILSTLIAACSFVYITTEGGRPKLKVIDGAHATGELATDGSMMLTEGYCVLDYDKYDNPLMEAYLTPGKTEIYEGGKLTQTIPNIAPYPLLVPLIYRSDAVRPFGHSRISRACMSIMSDAIRCCKRGSIAAEFGSFPQKYALNLDPDAEVLDSWNASMSTMLMIHKGQDGTEPKVGQFGQLSFSPHIEQLKAYAGLFAGEADLTLDDLGLSTDGNPQSAEAIKSAHENLRLAARKAQADFTVGLRNACYLAACLRDEQSYEPDVLVGIESVWAPIFEPDFAALASIGDALYKINEVAPGYITADTISELTGIEVSENAGEILTPAEIDEALQI